MSVCRTNFNLDAMTRFAWGRGIYLSKYPITSLLYGEALVVCKVLLGRKQVPSQTSTPTRTAAAPTLSLAPNPSPGRLLQEGYDSLEIIPNAFQKIPGKMSYVAGAFVIRSVEQILPFCVISAEYPKSIKIGGMQSASIQKKAAETAKERQIAINCTFD